MTSSTTEPEQETASPTFDQRASVHEVSRLHDAVTRLSLRLEQMNLSDLLEVSKRPWKLIWTNFVAGVARGVGMFLGAGVAGAITLGALTWVIYHALQVANMIPVIGQLVHLAQDSFNDFMQQHTSKR